MSEFHVVCVRVGEVTKHPNADTLSVTKVSNGYPVVIRTGDFREGDFAAYVPVDAVVPDEPEWEFLKGHRRIRASKIRGIFSMGLLTKLPFPPVGGYWEEGQDMAYQMGITKYEPPEPASAGGENEKDPGFIPHYTDIEGLRKYPDILVPEELVVLTEKIHGGNSRFIWKDGRLWCGSHNCIKKENPDNLFWRMADKYAFRENLARYPGLVFFGEVYGWVQDLRYGAKKQGDYWLRLFDIFSTSEGKYLDLKQAVDIAADVGVPWVPILYEGPWNPDLVSLAEGQSLVDPGTIREGFVVRPLVEGYDERIGRRVLKMPGEGYLTRKEK